MPVDPPPPRNPEPPGIALARRVVTFVLAFILLWVQRPSAHGFGAFIVLASLAGAITWICEALNDRFHR